MKWLYNVALKVRVSLLEVVSRWRDSDVMTITRAKNQSRHLRLNIQNTHEADWIEPPASGNGPPIRTVNDQPVLARSSSKTELRMEGRSLIALYRLESGLEARGMMLTFGIAPLCVQRYLFLHPLSQRASLLSLHPGLHERPLLFRRPRNSRPLRSID